jgi:hypothetical protein
MSGINNLSGSATTPIQHSSSQAPEPARLVIRTVDQARDHWRTITTPALASAALTELDGQVEGGHVDEETYRVLANTLRDIHNTLEERATAQAPTAHLPVRSPPSNVRAALRLQQRQLVPDPSSPGRMITQLALTQRQRRSAQQ